MGTPILPAVDYTAANPAVRAMTLGQIDYHLFTPWLPAERWLYPPATDFLADLEQDPATLVRGLPHRRPPVGHGRMSCGRS